LDIAPDPKTALILHPDDKSRIEELLAHGRKMIDVGYLAGARGYFKRAAEAGSAEAAIALGDTYDPDFIAEIGARGIPADLAEARMWYERAKILGSPLADERIAELQETAAAPAEAPDATSAPTNSPATQVPAAQAPTQAANEQGAGVQEWVEISGSVNVRATPDPNGETLKIAQAGARYRATARKGKWVQVTDPKTSEVGWVYSRFVATSNAP
jgi:hypothetical protein